MNDEPTVSLRDYLEARISAAEKATQILAQANERALTVAAEALTKRLEGLNEIRGAMEDRERRLASKESVEALEKEMASARKANFASLVGIVIVILGAIVAFVLTK